MRAFTDPELARLRATQEAAMQDRCVVQAYSSEPDEYGNPTVTYTAGDEIACGVEQVSPREVKGTGEVPVIQAKLRLPIGTVIDPRDRIQVMTRYGEALTTPQEFEIAGPVQQGPSGLVLNLRIVDDGTET